MTLTSFLDVKADPPKSDETKVDLLQNLSTAAFNLQDPPAERPPAYTVEYVEMYSYSAARRRRLCRIFAWLLAVFLLLDIGAVLYIGLRMRQQQRGSHEAGALFGGDDSSSYTCRLRFRQADGRFESRTELVSADPEGRQLLVQPSWDSDGQPTVLHSQLGGFTLLRAPSAGLCFVKPAAWRNQHFAKIVVNWAKKSHDVPTESVQFVRLVARYPALDERQLMSYGHQAWLMCRQYKTYLVEPVVFKFQIASKSSVNAEHSADAADGPAADKAEAVDRRRRAAPEQQKTEEKKRRQLQIDEGVLPAEEGGRSVHVIDVIEL